MTVQHVIVGSGIAGLSAAEAIRAHDPAAQITLISEEAHGFYSRPGLAYLLRGDIPERQLFIRTPKDLEALQIQRVDARVEQLLPAEHALQLTNGQWLRYHRLLVATGALASRAPFPGGDLTGVVKLDSLDDARRIVKSAWRFQTAVVVGGGITAMELAEGLRARGMRVHYFLRGTRYWSDVLDQQESEIVLRQLKHEGIKVRFETQVKQALGSRGKLKAVETQAGETIACRMLAVAIGVKPRVELAKQAGLNVARGIVVNEFLETSAPDVFAAGDVAEVTDPQTGKSWLDVLWPIALKQGQVAGANMAGARCPYRKDIPYNVTQLGGLRVTVIGAVGGGKNEDLVAITRGESESWRQSRNSWVLSQANDVNRVRLLVDGQRIVGALVMGDQTWSRPLQKMIIAGVDISPIRAMLSAGGDTAFGHLSRFYQQWEQTAPR